MRPLLAVILLFFFGCSILFGQVSDSLRNLSRQASGLKAKYELLASSSFLTESSPELVAFLDSLFHEVLYYEDYETSYAAISDMGRFYYNNEMLPSLYSLSATVDSLAECDGQYPDAYYDVEAYICQLNLWKGNYDVAMSSAITLSSNARNAQHSYGMVCSMESLGLVYQYLRRDSDAVAIFKEGLEILDKSEGRTGYKIQYVSNILECLLRDGDYEEAAVYVDRYESLLDKWKSEGERSHVEYPLDRCYWLLYIFRADISIYRDEAQEAIGYLKKADLYASLVVDLYVESLSDFTKARYFRLTQDYPRALEYINRVLNHYKNTDTYQFKASVLECSGDVAGALQLYKHMLQTSQETHDEAFMRQLNQFRSLYDLSKQEMQAKEMELQKVRLQSQNKQLRTLVILLVLLLIMSYVLFRLYRRQLTLKKAIEHEKEEAERANASKSAFIANISHEIRTPMNAIVGFSQLLVEDNYSQEERVLFSETINHNSDLLLNLINDVLDLSRMEAGNMKFVIKEVDLPSCIQEVYRSIEHKVHAEVDFLMDCPADPYPFNTDPLRLQQLLINLLSNASKFTEQGTIELSVRIDEEHRDIYFVVSDTGCGIPEVMRDKIFERFEKLNEYAQGTGLGLSICRVIADRLKGSIYLDTSYKLGARFVFRHPIGLLIEQE